MTGITIATVVEGHGEVAAVPVPLRRIAAEVAPEMPVYLPRPYYTGPAAAVWSAHGVGVNACRRPRVALD